MGEIYQLGEEKVRPGVYRRYTKTSDSGIAAALRGVFAIPVQADFGPVGEVTVHNRMETVKEMYGTGQTVKGALNLFQAGAATVYVYRLGSGGENGVLQLKDSNQQETAVTLTTRYPTDLSFKVILREKFEQEGTKELFVYQDAVLKESLEYSIDSESGEADEATILTDLVNKASTIFTARKIAEGAKSLADVYQEETTGGENPTVDVNTYSQALTAFEPYRWNVLVTDSVDKNIHSLLKAYMDRIKKNGALGLCVVGNTEKSFEERLSEVKAINSESIVYIGSGYIDNEGNERKGYDAVTMQAGVIGCTPASQSIVHSLIPDAADTLEMRKNEEYIQAIQNGMVLLAPNEEGGVWFDSGVTTLTLLKENQDAGWKKIRRAMTRFELFDRIERTTAPLIGRVNCDDQGIANLIKVAKDVLIEMEKEQKIRQGSDFYLDETSDNSVDSVHFIIRVYDIDSLEKIYLNYQFSFTGE